MLEHPGAVIRIHGQRADLSRPIQRCWFIWLHIAWLGGTGDRFREYDRQALIDRRDLDSGAVVIALNRPTTAQMVQLVGKSPGEPITRSRLQAFRMQAGNHDHDPPGRRSHASHMSHHGQITRQRAHRHADLVGEIRVDGFHLLIGIREDRLDRRLLTRRESLLLAALVTHIEIADLIRLKRRRIGFRQFDCSRHRQDRQSKARTNFYNHSSWSSFHAPQHWDRIAQSELVYKCHILAMRGTVSAKIPSLALPFAAA